MALLGGFWFLAVSAFLISAVDGTTSEGVALRTMMLKWKVDFPSWVMGEDPCTSTLLWTYVGCSNGHVISLNVSSTGLDGVLPQEVEELTSLEVLDFSTSAFSKGPPNKVSNPGVGEVLPASLAQCTQLRSLNLSNIQWEMPFPEVVTKLPLLEEIYMSSANLTGSIPRDFFKLSKLRSVFLGATEGSPGLTGDLKAFVQLRQIEYLSLYRNPINSPLYNELGTLTRLVYFNCHTCQLYGGLPESFGRLPNLQNLTIHRNALTGRIPQSWRNLISMRNLRFDTNYIYDEFPLWMMTNFPLLDSLYLSRNLFYGPLPFGMAEFESTYNISYRYNVLRWDCNYLNYPYTPCSLENPCTNRILYELGSNSNVTTPYIFDSNCYGDSTKAQLDEVQQCSKGGHELDCATFQRLIVNLNKCPACPVGQSFLYGEANPSCICTLGNGNDKGSVPIGAVVGGVIGLVFIFVSILAIVLWWRRKQFSFLDIFNTKRPDGHDAYWEVPPGVQRFTIKDLARITSSFNDDNVIGIGGFGKVYRGTLEDGRMVAIKRASVGSLQGIEEFRNEVSLLSRLHARNLVKLEGFCDEEEFQCLVYEYMQNGNLHTHLLREGTTTPLSWRKRIEIAYGVAQGLEYLHSFANPPVIHRDVKPANILLDENMVAKLADFGISKETPEMNTHISTRPAGTAGYLDPDYFLRRQLTTASDVYAYGVVMLELVTGQAAIDHERHEEYNLIEWVKKRFRFSGVVSIIDPLIEADYPKGTFSTMAELGLQCASFDRNLRPSMKTVLGALERFEPELRELLTKKSMKVKGRKEDSDKEMTYPEDRKLSSWALSPERPGEGLLQYSQSSTDPGSFGLVATMAPR